MDARISPSGIMSWQKFNSIPSGTTLSYIPEIECIPTGILYVGASLARETSPSNNYSSLLCIPPHRYLWLRKSIVQVR
ncbi:MAG: hypothetical protein IPN13_12070 [Bacteroidetes bacterium]|nr:hypothetical protein [Bacteroidota bacterium]